MDIANLTRQNIVEDRLIYQRQKTHGNINLLLSKEASTIIAKYSTYQQEAEYLFPILHCKRHIEREKGILNECPFLKYPIINRLYL